MSAAQSQVVNLLVLVILTAYVLYLRPWRRGRSRARGTRFDRFALLVLDLFVGAFLAVFVVALAVFGVLARCSGQPWRDSALRLPRSTSVSLCCSCWWPFSACAPFDDGCAALRVDHSSKHETPCGCLPRSTTGGDRHTISWATWRSMYSLTPR
jgi:hypothetical protein